MDSSYQVGSLDSTSTLHSPNPPSKLKTYGFAIAIIVGISGLAVGGFGVAGHFGAISSLDQVHAIIMMAAGGGSGAVLFIVGVVGTIKNCKTGTGGGRQTEFIEGTRIGRIRGMQRFGKTEWETYFGYVGKEPLLPANLDEILNSPCPFSGDESVKVRDTHMLVLVPAIVNGEALTLNKLKRLVKNSQNEGHATVGLYSSPCIKDEHGSTQVEQSHWVLMTRNVVPGSRNETYDNQKKLVNQYEGYSLPGALQAAVCILIEYFSSKNKLFGDSMYTRCAETVKGQFSVVVGGFTSNTLHVLDNYHNDYHYGSTALRKF